MDDVRFKLVNFERKSLPLHGSKTRELLMFSVINVCAYPLTPAIINLSVAAYSKSFDGKTFSKAS